MAWGALCALLLRSVLTHIHAPLASRFCPFRLLQGKRYVLPNTSIMLHHPSGVARGQASDIFNEARELMRLRDYVNSVLSLATGQPVEKVSGLCA
jgi:hypothetical protein